MPVIREAKRTGTLLAASRYKPVVVGEGIGVLAR
jgi:hypothetical protein